MSAVEIKPTVRIILAILYKVGLWKNYEESKNREIGRKLFYLFSYVLYLIILVTLAFLCDDVNQSIFAIEVVIGCMVLLVKLIYLLWKKDKILEFLHDSIDSNSFVDKLQAKKIQFLMKFALVYNLFVIVTCLISVVMPLLNFSSERKLPFFITFSLDCEYSNIIYWVAYIIIAWGVSCCFFSNLIITIIWYILLNYSINYQMLGNKFRNVDGIRSLETVTKVGKKLKTQKQDLYLRDFVTLVKSHRKLSGTIDQFKSFFHNLFLAQIIVSGIFICASVYVLAFTITTDNLFIAATYVAAFIYGVSDIFFVMYFANEITLASDRLSYCVFESNWIEQSRSCKKCIIIVSEFLKQPQQLVIFKLYPMNLKTFTMIMDTAYKMFNILKTLSGKK